MNRIRDLMHKLGSAVTMCADGIEDEGDRVYFDSTNDADLLKEVRQIYADYCCDTEDFGDEHEQDESALPG